VFRQDNYLVRLGSLNGLTEHDAIYLETKSDHIEEACAGRLGRARGRTLVRVTAVLFNVVGCSLFTSCLFKLPS